MKILLTAFQGTSSETLLNAFPAEYAKLVLENDKKISTQQLENVMKEQAFDYVFSFGQRPNIKDQVHIETGASIGGIRLETDFDCERLKGAMLQKGLAAKLSHNAGTSYCNHIYWFCMDYIKRGKLYAQTVFVHVPFEKNISDMEVFAEKLVKAVAAYRGGNG